MNDIGALRLLAFSGADWVIYLLILCSILVVAVAVDRLLVLSREQKSFLAVKENVSGPLEAGDLVGAAQKVSESDGVAAHILLAGMKQISHGIPAMEEHISASKFMERQHLERRLLILGTLGNNAPFIGLFGTVLGVIKAFHDLAQSASAGPEVVMQGLSEALIATAVGLLVAIPSVIAYNYFQKRVNDLLGQTDALVHLLMAQLKSEKR